MKEHGAAVVVTYNRVDKLESCLKCLLNQTFSLTTIYIINNASTDKTETFLDEFCKTHPQVKYMTTNENLGGAGGFHHAIKWAYDEGADWIWGMDDDAFPDNNALEEIMKQRTILEKDGSINCYWSNCNHDEDFKEDSKIVVAWMFVGFFLPRKVIENVGNCRNDFFIYFDDIEYASRIINYGYHIYKVKNSIINHKDAIPNIKKLKIGNINIQITLLPAETWKTYYLIRNSILRHGKDKKKRNKSIRACIRHLIKALMWNPRQVKYVWLGLIDGIWGKSGKIFSP